jgi:hypothetical protein
VLVVLQAGEELAVAVQVRRVLQRGAALSWIGGYQVARRKWEVRQKRMVLV